jgi:hypothetical protein
MGVSGYQIGQSYSLKSLVQVTLENLPKAPGGTIGKGTLRILARNRLQRPLQNFQNLYQTDHLGTPSKQITAVSAALGGQQLGLA